MKATQQVPANVWKIKLLGTGNEGKVNKCVQTQKFQ